MPPGDVASTAWPRWCGEVADPAGVGDGAGDVVRFGEARPALGDVERRQGSPYRSFSSRSRIPRWSGATGQPNPVVSYSGNAAMWNGIFSIASAVPTGLSPGPRPVATFTG